MRRFTTRWMHLPDGKQDDGVARFDDLPVEEPARFKDFCHVPAGGVVEDIGLLTEEPHVLTVRELG